MSFSQTALCCFMLICCIDFYTFVCHSVLCLSDSITFICCCICCCLLQQSVTPVLFCCHQLVIACIGYSKLLYQINSIFFPSTVITCVVYIVLFQHYPDASVLDLFVPRCLELCVVMLSCIVQCVKGRQCSAA